MIESVLGYDKMVKVQNQEDVGMKKRFEERTCEATNAHSTIPASPLKPRRHASANLTAAYAYYM